MPRYAMYQMYYAQYCESAKGYGLDSDGPACVDAIEAYFVCLSKTNCADLAQGPEVACPAEVAAIEAACPNLSGGGGETSGGSSG